MDSKSVKQAAALVAVSTAATWIAASYYFRNNCAENKDGKDLKSGSTRQQDQVRDDYAATITNQEETVGCCETAVHGNSIGYTDEELKLKSDDKMLACGNPVTLAALQAGEYVLDLGCGAGLDCVLA